MKNETVRRLTLWRGRRQWQWPRAMLLVVGGCLLSAMCGFAQQPSESPAAQSKPQAQSAKPETKPAAPTAAQPGVQNKPADTSAPLDQGLPPEDWAVELLSGMIDSPSSDAQDALLDAGFAAGPALVPQLRAALADDRTAEFAAQALAYIGGGEALKSLAELLRDPRDLNLRRFYFGALGEYRSPEAKSILLFAIDHANSEPDRTVMQNAILALTVQSDTSILAQLRTAEAKIADVVVHDDLDSAIEIIQERAKYLTTPAGQKSGETIQQAVRSYFIPALEEPQGTTLVKPPIKPPARQGTGQKGGAPAQASTPAKTAPAEPPVKLDIQNLTFSPDKSRALARVMLDAPAAVAYYDIVLQKHGGEWTIASAWLGSEAEKPGAESPEAKPQE